MIITDNQQFKLSAIIDNLCLFNSLPNSRVFVSYLLYWFYQIYVVEAWLSVEAF